MINTSIGLVGVAKQASRDQAATAPTYVHGLTGGSPFGVERSLQVDSVACGMRANADAYIESVSVNPNFECRAYADAMGLWLLAALGAVSTTGDAAPYTHVFTMGDALPYLTVWGQVGTSDFTRASGVKVDQLEMSFDGNAPLSVSVQTMGIAGEMGLASIPGSAEPSCFDGYFVPVDGVFKLETLGDEPAEAIVTSFSMTVANNCEPIVGAGKVTPSDIAEKKCVVSGSIGVMPDTMALYRKTVTGSATGTTLTGKTVYGSFSVKLTHTQNPAWSLLIEGDRVPFNADYIEVDPDGGDGVVEFSFDEALIAEKGGSPVTVTLVNGVASY